MRFFPSLLAAMLLCGALPATADLLPPQAVAAAERLRENPRAFDRMDNFCDGRKVGQACTIAGSTLAGGGDGVCQNQINRRTSTLDLVCVRTATLRIDRQLPEDGFVHDASLCAQETRGDGRAGPRFNCKPTLPTPADRFCRGKDIGGACTVELTYGDAPERHDGVCREVVESRSFYYQGPQTMTRQVVVCESAAAPAPRTFTTATWWQKLWQ